VELLHHLVDPLERLLRRKNLASHPGPRLVDAVEVPDAVVALDVASRGDGEVHPAEPVAGLLAEAGMLLDPPQLLWVPGNLLVADLAVG
jgi:hypothetical protein